jgi:hypothetical protein
MRLSLTLVTLLLTTFLQAQIPSVNYYGEPPMGKNFRDFISLSPGQYSVFGNGYADGNPDSDICIVSFNEVGGPISLNSLSEAGNQSVLHVASLPNDRYVVCSSTNVVDQLFRDIKLTVYHMDGTVVNTTFIGGPYNDGVERFTVDEDGNIYLIIRRGTDAYNMIEHQFQVIKYDADLAEIYNEELVVLFNQIPTITTLADGQLALASSDFLGVVTVRVLSAIGETVWIRDYSTNTIAGIEQTKSLFDGTNIKLILSNQSSLWTLDVTNGDQIDEQALPVDLPTIALNTQFLEYDDSFWLVYNSDIYQVSTDAFDNLVVEEQYEMPADVIQVLHPDGEEAIVLLSFTGDLFRFNFESGLFTTIETLVDGVVSFLERVDRLSVNDNGITLGLSHNAGFNEELSLVQASEAGELIEKIILDPEGTTSSYEILSVADDKLSLLIANFGEGGKVSFYNLDGSLRSSVVLTDADLNWVDGVTLEDGRIIGICAFQNTPNIQFYEIDPLNETAISLGEFMPSFSVFPGFTHALEGNHIGFVAFGSGSEYRAAKVNTDGQVIWENTYELGEFNSRSFSPYTEWKVNPAGDTYVVATVSRVSLFDAPFYDVKVLDTDGNVMNEFLSLNTFVDATPIFASDDEIVVIGTDFNLDNQTDGEQFLLYYQRYDLTGDLLFERVHELPYLMYFHQLEFLPNQNLALMGRASVGGGIDAVFVIMDEQGTITKVSTLSPAWGQLQLGPNPGRDFLQLRLDNEYQGALQISLLDTKGQQLHNWTANKLADSWSWQQTLHDIPAGTYWINISSPEGQVTKAWLKQ